VLDPDFDAWLGRTAGPPRDRLHLVDPLHTQQATVAGHAAPLAINLDGPIDLLGQIVDGTNYRFVALLRPEKALDIAGLYMLQPYQPGKIPVVLVHGLASSPLTWNDLIGDLRSDPAFRERYQLWLFTYPTGVGFLRNAALLREQLAQLQDELDPDGSRPEVRRAVLIGHSMGGLISKLQITASEDRIWNTYATRPLETLVASPEIQAQARRLMFFTPQPGVRRVVYVAAPHLGSNLANELPGRLSSALIRPLTDAKDMMDTIDRDNPGLLRPEFRQVQTGVDMLERDHPLLLTMTQLRVSPAVTTHSIIGTGTRAVGRPRGDSVVPIESARIPGVASEIFVPENHGGVHHNERSTAEILRILDEHWREMRGGTLADPRAPRDGEARPVGFADDPEPAIAR
jgi:pimeloyl-ACP methyl ester carboxylesterase